MVEFIIASVLPWTVTVVLALLLAYCALNIKKFLYYSRRHIASMLILCVIVFFGAYLRFGHSTFTHRTYYDEDRYLSYAVTFARFNQARDIEFATPEKIILGKPDKVARITVPVVHGWVLKLFGYSEYNLFAASKLFSVLQIVLIYCIALLMYRKSAVALIAALLMALLPSSIYWSSSTVLDPYFVSFALIALIGGLIYAVKPNYTNLMLSVMTIVPLLFTRLEAALFLGIIILCGFAVRKNQNLPLITRNDRYWVAAVLLMLGFRAFISVSLIGQTWCCGESTPLETFRAPFFIRHLLLNLGNLFLLPEVPWILSVLAFGTIMAKKDWRSSALGVWLFTFFVLYSSYYAGRFFDYQFSGSYGRFFLILIPPLLILASSAVVDLFELVGKMQMKERVFLYALGIALIVLGLYPTASKYKAMISTSPFYLIVEKKPEDFHSYWENIVLKKIPKNSLIIHSLTGLILLHDHPTMYYGSMYDNKATADYIIKSLKDGVEVYSLPEYICQEWPKKCRYFNDKVVFSIVPESTISADLNYMKLELKK